MNFSLNLILGKRQPKGLKAGGRTPDYSLNLVHGIIWKGLNDYDAIFRALKFVNFDGWISIEDSLNGMDELRESAEFLTKKIRRHFMKS
ncbi:MAG: hypothetical protein QW231_05690 [Candidatus Bathyarchaeia archaeon]